RDQQSNQRHPRRIVSMAAALQTSRHADNERARQPIQRVMATYWEQGILSLVIGKPFISLCDGRVAR
ncbi:MAG: hypothetical protein ACUVXC_18290, partial [Chloroflexus sp.]